MKRATGTPKILKFGNVSFKVFATKDNRVGFQYKAGSHWKVEVGGELENKVSRDVS